ncbi:hypothetical protein EV360DRAFT_88490 [Lentinula raphanica]|nr:hypothetical protein EV360DRAFT_88490 [Lentinula raphanica]
MLVRSVTSTATYMLSYANWADLPIRIFSSADPGDTTPVSTSSSWAHGETARVFTAVGVVICFALGLKLIIICVLKVCYYAAATACAWIYRCVMWSRIRELERREKAVELKETMNACQARTLSLDIEIGVCKRLLEIFRGSVTSQEDRVLELEKEKELVWQELLCDEREALDHELIRRRISAADLE